ncbi:MAG: glycosyltransferase family 2 protein [Candidatus Pacebacteria bacterium]|nr:glycosyltransferase family 2 protein [Candidatus Paceibacterota bacterium]
MKSNVFIVIPAYNEDHEVVRSVIEGVVNEGFCNIIVVDDGSEEEIKQEWWRDISCLPIVLRHVYNLGKGAAVRTGVQKARSLGADVIVTFDADGQHDPRDIKLMVRKIEKGYDVVLGRRFFGLKNMPLYNICANKIANFFTWIFCGLRVEDSQCGFRAYGPRSFPIILNTQSSRYEYESEIIREIGRHDLSYVEISVQAIYTTYSKNKKTKQDFWNGLKTLFRIGFSQ